MTRTRVALGLVVLAIVATAYVLLTRPAGHQPDGAGASHPEDVAQARPHCGGEAESLSSALSDAPYTVTLPNETAASSTALEATWDCPGSATLMEFSTGLTLALDVNTIADPAAAWKGLADSDPRIYSVGEVKGVPASFIDPDGDPNDDAEGGVTFVVDGIYVSVGGNGKIPLSDLVVAAEGLEVSTK